PAADVDALRRVAFIGTLVGIDRIERRLLRQAGQAYAFEVALADRRVAFLPGVEVRRGLLEGGQLCPRLLGCLRVAYTQMSAVGKGLFLACCNPAGEGSTEEGGTGGFEECTAIKKVHGRVLLVRMKTGRMRGRPEWIPGSCD